MTVIELHRDFSERYPYARSPEKKQRRIAGKSTTSLLRAHGIWWLPLFKGGTVRRLCFYTERNTLNSTIRTSIVRPASFTVILLLMT